MQAIVWGGTGQCKAIVPILEDYLDIIAIFDNTPNMKSPYRDIPLFHDSYFDEWKEKHKTLDLGFVIAIGNPHAQARRDLANKLEPLYIQPLSPIHTSACIGKNTKIPKHTQILAKANIRENVKIKPHCIFNCGSLVEHDCILHEGVEIGPGAVVCGQVEIKENSWIGANSTILPFLTIGKNCIIGAGSVVTKNVPDNTIVVGNPAKKLRDNI